MATLVGVGHSLQKNPADAGKEAAVGALQQAGVTSPDFVFVFATVGYNQQALLAAVREATGNAPLSGCSGEGVITQGMVAETNFGVTVMAITSDELKFANVCVKDISSGVDAAGERLAAEIQPLLGPDSIACFLFVDGLVFDFDPFHAAFDRSIRHDRPLPFFGGLAADNWSTRKTYQYHDTDAFPKASAACWSPGRGVSPAG